ncbi:VIP peptides isoform X1 [Sminthopsis crassicaudata]|uniref:VIP peptides n=2 Tax=Dasyuridae TaxID=9277 RepID=UPI002235FDD0|nr:VIP peptides [Antechinus flavipes]
MSGSKKMEARSNSQLLVSLMLLSVFCSQTLALPLEIYSTMRQGNDVLFDGPNEPDQNLVLLKLENDRLRNALPANGLSSLDVLRALNSNIRNLEKRHSDSVFTDSYTQFLRREALRKYFENAFNGKRSEENPPASTS